MSKKINRTNKDLKGGYPVNVVRNLRRGVSIPDRQRREQRQNVSLPPLSHTPTIRNTNPIAPITPIATVTLPAIPLTPWVADEDCVGKEDPITFDSIPEGRGFKLIENDRETCYDVVTLAKTMRLRDPLTPYTRVPFSEIDKKRIKDYMKQYPIGGKKTHKKRKTNNTKKSRKVNKRRKTIRRIK